MPAPRAIAARAARAALAACAACAASAACGGGGPKITLRYHPPAGAAYHYALEQQNSMKFEAGPMSAMPEQSLTMHMYFTQLVTGPAQGGTAVTVTFDSTTLDAPGMAPGGMQSALERMRGAKSDIVYDDRMHVLSAAFSGLPGDPTRVSDQMGRSIKTMAFPLPDGPVGVGDSWTTENELPLGQLNASAPVKSKTTLTVKEIQVTGADTSVLLRIQTTFPGEPVTLTQEGRQVTMKLSGGLTGEQVYSLTRGAQVRATMGGTMRINVTGGPTPGGMTMAMTQQTSLQLTGAQ